MINCNFCQRYYYTDEEIRLYHDNKKICLACYRLKEKLFNKKLKNFEKLPIIKVKSPKTARLMKIKFGEEIIINDEIHNKKEGEAWIKNIKNMCAFTKHKIIKTQLMQHEAAVVIKRTNK